MSKRTRVAVEGAGELEIRAEHPDGTEADASILEEADVAFDPTTMHLQLSKEEKRRTTALMMAIQAYNNLIIKDAEYLREAHNHERNGGPVIRPATMDAMVVAAIQFDAFIAGKLRLQVPVQSGVSADPLPEDPEHKT